MLVIEEKCTVNQTQQRRSLWEARSVEKGAVLNLICARSILWIMMRPAFQDSRSRARSRADRERELPSTAICIQHSACSDAVNTNARQRRADKRGRQKQPSDIAQCQYYIRKVLVLESKNKWILEQYISNNAGCLGSHKDVAIEFQTRHSHKDAAIKFPTWQSHKDAAIKFPTRHSHEDAALANRHYGCW